MSADKPARRMSPALTGVTLLVALVVIALDHLVIASGPLTASASRAEAVLNNFAPDLLHGDDGLPPSPRFPLKYGPVNTALDVDGDALDAHEAHLAYFEGQYWMYGREWGCGTMARCASLCSNARRTWVLKTRMR